MVVAELPALSQGFGARPKLPQIRADEAHSSVVRISRDAGPLPNERIGGHLTRLLAGFALLLFGGLLLLLDLFLFGDRFLTLLLLLISSSLFLLHLFLFGCLLLFLLFCLFLFLHLIFVTDGRRHLAFREYIRPHE